MPSAAVPSRLRPEQWDPGHGTAYIEPAKPSLAWERRMRPLNAPMRPMTFVSLAMQRAWPILRALLVAEMGDLP
jgi:hypothetical protein